MILIVEDDDTTRELTAAMLRLAGHHVLTAADGHEALAILELERPSVIFADLRMPNMDGWSFRQCQRHLPDVADIPFIIVSADLNLEEEGRALAAVTVMAKPVDIGDMIRHARKYDSPRVELPS